MNIKTIILIILEIIFPMNAPAPDYASYLLHIKNI